MMMDEQPGEPSSCNNPSKLQIQQLSIQLLNLKKVFPDNASLSDAVKHIINIYNKAKQKNPEEQLDKSGLLIKKDRKGDESYILQDAPNEESFPGGFSVEIFCSKKSRVSNFAKQTSNPEELETHTSHFIAFFYRETPCRRIFALTTSSAWCVVRQFVDNSFPIEVAQRVANPLKISKLVRRCLFGQNTKEDLLYPEAFELYKTSNLYYLVENFKCDLKTDSSLLRLILQQKDKESGRCWINVTTGGILRIGKRIRWLDYPDILDLLAKLLDGALTRDDGTVETVDPRFGALHLLKPACASKQLLDGMMIDNIFTRWTKGKKQLVDVRHKNLDDYLLSDCFAVQIRASEPYQIIGSSPPVMADILKRIGAANEEEFRKIFKEGHLGYIDQQLNLQKEKIIDCVEGLLIDSADSYFKIRKMWYVIEADYMNILCRDFWKLLKSNTLIANDEEGYLRRLWSGNKKPDKSNDDNPLPPKKKRRSKCSVEANEKGEREEEYCRAYLEEPMTEDEGYLCFDQVLADNIEAFDLLKYTKETVYLYHVKEKLGQDTRDAVSQIMNSATMIRSVLALNCQLEDYLKKLWKRAVAEDKKENKKKVEKNDWRQKLKSRLEAFGEENFYNLFRTRKIVFVYAYLPDPDNTFSKALETLDEQIEQIPERIIRELIAADFLDSDRCVTSKFYSISKENFMKSFRPTGCNQETIGQIYDQLAAGRFSRSTIAKIELLRVAQNLRELNFDFKICEIPKYVHEHDEACNSTLSF